MAAAAAGIGASTKGGGGVSTIEGHLRGARASSGGGALSTGKLSSCFPALMSAGQCAVPTSATCDSMTGLLSHPAPVDLLSPTDCTAAAPAAALTSNHVRQLLRHHQQQPPDSSLQQLEIQPQFIQSFDDDEYTCSPSVIYDDDDETIMSTGTLRH